MAIATAVCTCEKCGATFTRTARKNNRTDAQSWEQWAVEHYTICPDCEDKANAERAAKFAQEAAEDGLPPLKGSEKQVVWAEQIRHEKIIACNNLIAEQIEQNNTEFVKAAEIVLAYILKKDTARWWIDEGRTDSLSLLNNNYQAAMDAEAVRAAANVSQMQEDKPEAKQEDTVLTPENAQYGTAKVAVTNQRVEVRYPKDDKFREVVKAAGFYWDSESRCWKKDITQFTGSAIDRASDLINRLLAAGFSVDCANAEAREKSVSGAYGMECIRWISIFTSGNYAGWLAIKIPREDKDSQKLYDAARKIKGSRWSKGYVAVPVAQCDSVEDFAEIYSYKLSTDASKAIAAHREATTVTAAEPVRPPERDVLGDILNSDDAVLPDLADE